MVYYKRKISHWVAFYIADTVLVIPPASRLLLVTGGGIFLL